MSTQPNEEVPRSGERKQKPQLKAVGSTVTKAPREAASIMGKAGRVAYRYTSRTVRDIRKADLRFHTNPAELAQTITASAQATVIDLTGTAATRIGRTGSTAAGKAGDLAGTAAQEIADAAGMTKTAIVDHSRGFHERCKERFASLDLSAPKFGDNLGAGAQAAATAAWGALVSLEQAVPSFSDLSPTLKAKFVAAGMHGGSRTVDAASAFYESSVPSAVRNLGKDAVVAFLDGKHASHIEAVANAPGRMMDAANIVWEAARDNLARGAANMTPFELAKANALNALHATGIVAAEALQTAAVAGCIGMALEGVVSMSESVIYVYKDEMTLQEARRRVLKDVLKKGKAAAIGGAGMTVVVALGAGPALATAAPVLVSVGGVLYLVSAYSRIKTALDSADEHGSSDEHLDQLALDPSPPALGTA